MSKKRVTITDVAKKAGVSIATVSRVINDTDYHVNDELRERVAAAAKELQYMPNFFGRSLKSGKSRDIGVILPSMVNPFYSEVIAGVEKECRSAGYNPIICTSSNKPDKEKELIRLLQGKCVEGMLISTINDDSDFIRKIIGADTNIVIFDQPIPDFSGDSVTFDFYQAGMLSAQYLVNSGHTCIAFLSAPFERFSRRAVYSGFCDALSKSGDAFQKKNLFISKVKDFKKVGIDEFENGRRLAKMFLKAHCPATAIVTINDITAFGIIQELVRGGCRVPEDVSVIGFDNINFSAMFSPALTTISQPSFEMGTMAARVLLERIKDRNKNSTQILMKPAIVERESVKKLTEPSN
jgi:LacI family transcriptional regulator